MDAKTSNLLGDLSALGVGVMAWMNTTTSKEATYRMSTFGGKYPLSQRFVDAVGLSTGIDLSDFTDRRNEHGLLGPSPRLFGWVNKTVAGGIVLGLADYLAAELYPPYDKDFDGLRKIVKGVATGLVIGGAVGGVLDPTIQGIN